MVVSTPMSHQSVKLALSALLLASNLGADEAPSWRVERGATQVLVPLRPGGAFSATTASLGGVLTLEPGKPARLTGELSIDLATIDTGIGLRNQHLREKYLEVGKGKDSTRPSCRKSSWPMRTARASTDAPRSPASSCSTV
jgi:polyisoprenoid-binding protein YceI